MSIGVTGATGQLGKLIVEKIRERVPEAKVVALVRTPAKAASLGVEAREADYSKPAQLAEAFKGIETLVLVSSNELGQRAQQHRNAIEAAKQAGVRRIVYTSLLRADTSAITILAGEHLVTEVDLKASGVEYTILRNGWYTENYTGSIPGALAGGAFLGAAGQARISSAERADYAEAAAVVAIAGTYANQVLELAGDASYTLRELAAELSAQTGKTIPYVDLTEAEYAAKLESFGFSKQMAAAYASFDSGAAAGALHDEGRVLSRLIGRPTTPLATSVAAALKA